MAMTFEKKFDIINPPQQNAVIKVIGVGGGGGNAVAHMQEAVIAGVECISANTDAQALRESRVHTPLQLGASITKGLGAGSDPEVGRKAALDDRDSIGGALEGADMVFITAGMGGGTGTGATPVIAQIAREMGALTVAVVTRPFSFEGPKRMRVANEGIKELEQCVDSLIIIPNEKLRNVLPPGVSVRNAFDAANDVLLNAVQGISELITKPGLVNVDFADVRTVMSEMGMAMMGAGKAAGENRARRATEEAISSPLLEGVDLAGAKGILANVASSDPIMDELYEVYDAIGEYAAEGALIVPGLLIDEELGDELRVTVVAAGLNDSKAKAAAKAAKADKGDKNRQRPLPIQPGGRSEDDRKPDYREYDPPTVVRVRGDKRLHLQDGEEALEKDGEREEREEDHKPLDVPAFLRRQAD